MNKIKILFTALAIFLSPLLSLAQESQVQKWAHSFEGKKGITVVSISRTMFKMLSRIKTTDPEYQDIVRFASKLQDFKIITSDEQDNPQFKNMLATAPFQQYEELMSIDDGDNRIVFRVLEVNNAIRELVMTITGADQVFMFIKGDFHLNELTEISDNLNISGINKIKKAKK